MELSQASVGYSKYHNQVKVSPDTTQALDVQRAKPKNPDIERYIKRLTEGKLFGHPYVKQYLYDQYRRGCRPNTISSNFLSIILFIIHLKSLGRTCLEQVTRNDLSRFVEHEQDRDLKPHSVSTRLRSLYAFLGYLVEREIVHPDVIRKKMYIKVPDALPRAIDPENIKQLLSVIKKPRDRAMIMVLLRTGMRIGELLTTTLEDLNLNENRIEIFEAHKNRVGRVVYISDDALRALKRWIALREPHQHYLFYGRQGRPLCYEAARTMFINYLDKADLSHKGYTLHCLRHTFASELLNAGMRLECLQQLLGHSSIEMTRRYARLTDNTRKEEYFKAMAIIESGGINGHYRCDYQLP